MILFVKDLTVIDFSYLCDKRGPLGESWIVDLEMHGDLNDESMVLDFSLVKKQVKRIIDDVIDHKLAIATQGDAVISNLGEQTNVSFSFGEHQLAVSSPQQAFCFIDTDKIDEASVKLFLEDTILPQLPKNVSKIVLNLRPEHTNGFYYHYSHGLKKHDGNCQRIIHGHRSTIEIEENGMRSPRLNKLWCQKWQDIYLVSEEDRISAEQLKFLSPVESGVHSAYTSSQGYFELSISEAVVDILPVDSTVECIAQHIAHTLKNDNPESSFRVAAYEGVGKGAIAYA
ncbi:6-carboxytetrahydropterin synthase [Pseudoalteromonas sp. SSM20]|uniref:6-carboxytetrahydropterin synthase n=1 Tax=Pseudoalteromonas sp. SSM20 TaxID=3139394 RepID=UPI003BAA0F39